jgi:hypothetical protein
MDAEVEYHEDTLMQKSDDEYDEDQFAGRVAIEADKIWLNHTQMSGQVDKLFTAMAKAQGEMGHASKTEENEFYGSKYADLAACFEAVRQPMFMNGLCIIQSPAAGIGRADTENDSDYDGFPATVCLDTVIGHVSGQWISSSLTMRLVRDDPHGVGSAITYARRYALTSMLGVAQADDDGNAATMPEEAPAKKKPAKKKPAKKKAPDNAETQLDRLNNVLKEVGCSNKEEADLVCAWLFDDHSLTVDMCRENETSSQAFSARVDEVVATGFSLDEFLTRAAVWRDGTQEEATT